MLSKIPMGRFGLKEEAAALVAWLCSEECSFSTGAVFDLSGGRSGERRVGEECRSWGAPDHLKKKRSLPVPLVGTMFRWSQGLSICSRRSLTGALGPSSTSTDTSSALYVSASLTARLASCLRSAI